MVQLEITQTLEEKGVWVIFASHKRLLHFIIMVYVYIYHITIFQYNNHNHSVSC